MVRSIAAKVMWVGRATVFLVGLAVVLALVLGAASVALGADGDFFKVGRTNLADSVSKLTKSGAGPALDLRVDSGPPLAVNRQAKVANLNADKVDGFSSEQLRGAYASVINTDSTPSFDETRTAGFASVTRTSTGHFCLEPASGVEVRHRAVAVSVDWLGTQDPEGNGRAMFAGSCGPNAEGIQVITERQINTLDGVLVSNEADDVAFHVVVP